MVRQLSEKVFYIGSDDLDIDLFESQYIVPEGVSYNSYLIRDSKIAVLDTSDARKGEEWKANLAEALAGREPDYLVVHHMEPDHSALIAWALGAYPGLLLVASAKAVQMLGQFFDGIDLAGRTQTVKEGDVLELGEHSLRFFAAPMVHWPEVMVSFDAADGALYSADAFGKFGALDVEEDWDCEARRYFIGIVGKFGTQVQAVLKKAAGLDIQTICPLHGPVLKEDLGFYINLYDIWSSYRPEDEGVAICYTSVYGHTAEAAKELYRLLEEKGVTAEIFDLARDDMAEAVENAFRYSKLVLATTTYNTGIFPFMHTFIDELKERNFQSRKVAIIENGSWAPMAKKNIQAMLEGSKDITYAENCITIKGAMNDANLTQLQDLAEELAK
jgi:flavorubredoxin